jgi:hypothetical protein
MSSRVISGGFSKRYGKGMAAAEPMSVAKRGVVTPFVRRASKDVDDRGDLVEELERLRRENIDLRAQLAAERAQIVMDAALSAAARVLAVVRGEAELRVAEARWALDKMRRESDAAIAAAHDELVRLAYLKRQVSDQTNAFAADLTALVKSHLVAEQNQQESLDQALADRLPEN